MPIRIIWQRVFPGDMPRADLDYDRLARLNVAGGNIYNIALNAAFMAARAGSPVTMPLVLDAARAEFRKLERPINEMDFRWLRYISNLGSFTSPATLCKIYDGYKQSHKEKWWLSYL